MESRDKINFEYISKGDKLSYHITILMLFKKPLVLEHTIGLNGYKYDELNSFSSLREGKNLLYLLTKTKDH